MTIEKLIKEKKAELINYEGCDKSYGHLLEEGIKKGYDISSYLVERRILATKMQSITQFITDLEAILEAEKC